MENKKIKGATGHHYDGIDFESGLEVDTYKALKEAGLKFGYNRHTYHVFEVGRPKAPCYDVFKDRKLKQTVWALNKYKPTDIKYTPDFTLAIKDGSGTIREIFIESKGYPNDRYAYVKKMFRVYLDKHFPNGMFFEVHNKRQIRMAIEIIKNLQHENKDNFGGVA